MSVSIGPNAAGQNIQGSAGNDVISSGGGSDVVSAGDGDDKVSGGANKDLLKGGAGNDVMNGDSSNDILLGGAGDDYLFGGAQDDSLVGGTGSDHLIGGEDDDKLYLGTTNSNGSYDGVQDWVYFAENDGKDQVFGFEAGLDTLVLTEGTDYTLSSDGISTFLTYGSTTAVFYNALLTSGDVAFAPMPDFNLL